MAHNVLGYLGSESLVMSAPNRAVFKSGQLAERRSAGKTEADAKPSDGLLRCDNPKKKI